MGLPLSNVAAKQFDLGMSSDSKAESYSRGYSPKEKAAMKRDRVVDVPKPKSRPPMNETVYVNESDVPWIRVKSDPAKTDATQTALRQRKKLLAKKLRERK